MSDVKIGDELSSADPSPAPGCVVIDSLGRQWTCDLEGDWIRDSDWWCDPESWTKVAGNYGPVVVVSLDW